MGFSAKYYVFHAYILILEIIAMEESDRWERDENLKKQESVALSQIRFASFSERSLISI